VIILVRILAQTLPPLSKPISAILAELVTLTLPSPEGRGGKGKGKQDALITDHSTCTLLVVRFFQAINVYPFLPRGGRETFCRKRFKPWWPEKRKKPLLNTSAAFWFRLWVFICFIMLDIV